MKTKPLEFCFSTNNILNRQIVSTLGQNIFLIILFQKSLTCWKPKGSFSLSRQHIWLHISNVSCDSKTYGVGLTFET